MKLKNQIFTTLLITLSMPAWAGSEVTYHEVNPYIQSQEISETFPVKNVRLISAYPEKVVTRYMIETDTNCGGEPQDSCSVRTDLAWADAVRVSVAYNVPGFDTMSNDRIPEPMEFYLPASELSTPSLEALRSTDVVFDPFAKTRAKNLKMTRSFFTLTLSERMAESETIDYGRSDFCLDSDGRPMGGSCQVKIVRTPLRGKIQVVSVSVK